MTPDFFNTVMSTLIQGVAYLGFEKDSALIIIIAVLALLVIGGAAWVVLAKKRGASAKSEVPCQARDDKKCQGLDDKKWEAQTEGPDEKPPAVALAVEEEPKTLVVEKAAEPVLPPPVVVAPAPVVAPPAPEPLPLVEEPKEPEEAALTEALNKTKSGFMAKLAAFFKRDQGRLSDGDLEEIESILYGADLGVKTVDKLLTALREKLVDGAHWQDVLKEEMKQILHGHDKNGHLNGASEKPQVILFVGVNGAGKTTSIGKLGKRFSDEGKRVVFGAGDTFRAAAVTQLQVWAERVNAGFVSGSEKSDSASVLFETIKRGKDEGFDVVLCDTAGRLHTKTELMDELKKVYRVAEKSLGRSPDEVLLVIDATMGQNALVQAREFSQSAPISGVVLSKVDGTAKGGIALAIVEELKIPIRYIGVGEKDTDLKAFDADQFVDALFL